jgi:REP element-mobilizing transposase RayT
MTISRKAQVSLDSTPYYHCVARCVRRAHLCGQDRYTGKSFDHRKKWLVDRFKFQASIFGVDICAYAVMGNHYHLILHIDRERVLAWTSREVVWRWSKMFNGSAIIRRYLASQPLSEAELAAVEQVADIWRQRLYDLSWFMRCLNEYIARRANSEDECKGRFWEGRFRSQALLDRTGLAACMAYVDLNPLRAGAAAGLRDSRYTSVHERLRLASQQVSGGHGLMPFSEASDDGAVLPFRFPDYLDLLKASAAFRPARGASMSERQGVILRSLQLELPQWTNLLEELGQFSHQALGEMDSLRAFSRVSGRKYLRGSTRLSRIYVARDPA